MGDSIKSFQLLSTVFKNGSEIPVQYTCRGQNINPALNILGTPSDAKSLALIMHDPDAVSGDFVHWLMWDIPPSTESISTNSVPVGAVQGRNGAGNNNYIGPCPPPGTGTHRYIFELYALDKSLSLVGNTDRGTLQKTMTGHIIAKAELVGLFKALDQKVE